MLWIKVEPTVGNSIEQTAEEMISLAKHFGDNIGIECDFNGVQVIATIDHNVKGIVTDYRRSLGKETEYR